jgi:hypothetical protein
MEENTTGKILAWIGLGCGVVSLIGSCCPVSIVLLALVNFVSDTSAWGSEDNQMLTMFGVCAGFGLLAAFVLGGFSIYYLLKNRER